jgi:hypothetical protein
MARERKEAGSPALSRSCGWLNDRPSSFASAIMDLHRFCYGAEDEDL